MNVSPSFIVWSGMSVTIGASFKLLTVKVAGSLSVSSPGSVAVNVIFSPPYQSGSGMFIVATRLMSIVTVRLVFPVYVHVISSTVLSTSLT